MIIKTAYSTIRAQVLSDCYVLVQGSAAEIVSWLLVLKIGTQIIARKETRKLNLKEWKKII